jgi:2-keto-4-pentenoate hydratase/2-oxohepta-3-ene-1,7-dioic acid hydratase in catechol pathway
MRKAYFSLLGVVIFVVTVLPLSGQGIRAAEPFKVGTFSNNGDPWVGIVLRDQFIVELNAANREFESGPNVMKVPMPADMKELITRYQSGMQRRLYEIVNSIVAASRLEGQSRPAYIHQVGRVKTLAPILYPTKMLNAAVNYYGHVDESSPPDVQKAAAEARRKDRGSPYLFMKPTVGAIIGDGDEIVLPRGRNQIDWECEIGVVIGRTTKYVKSGATNPYIFGYTIQLDISDRGGRPSPSQFNSDWLIGKGHDTFAPMGPWIVPREFVKDVFNLTQKLWVNDKLMQDGNSSDMIHTINELVGYASDIMTLYPGDVIAAGSPAGTGMSRSVRPEQVFLKPGDKIRAEIQGIGTLHHTVVAEKGKE